MTINTILAEIECGFLFDTAVAEVHGVERYHATVLRVGKVARCNTTGRLDHQWGRPWLIPEDWSRDKVHATVLTACKFWLEHELREQFVVRQTKDDPWADKRPFYPNH